MENSINRSPTKDNFSIKDFFKLLKNYFWLIAFVIIGSYLVANMYLSLTVPTYTSTGSLEVISYDKGQLATDDLVNSTFYSVNKEVGKDIEKLKTFKINQRVIKDMNFSVQIFVQENYRKHELYAKKIPLLIKDIKIIDDNILGKIIKFTPKIDGYYLEIENSYKDKIFNKLFNKKLLKFNTKELLSYDKIIQTKYFQFSLKKIKELSGEPIYLKLNGDKRYIYDNFIANRLTIHQKNKEAPIIDISYEDNIPQRATTYVNKLIKVFEAEGRAKKSERNNNIEKFLKNGLKENTKELKKAEKALEKYKIKNKIIETSKQLNLINKDLNNLEMKIVDNRFQEIIINNILQLINNNKLSSIGPLLASLNDKLIVKHLNKLEELKLKEKSLASEYTDEYPELMIIRKQIENTQNNIYLSIKSLQTSIEHKKRSLYKIKNKKDKDFDKLPIYETNIVNLTRKYKKLLEINDYFFKKLKENDTIKAAIISDYSIVEEANLPKKPIKPRVFVIQVLSLILGSVLGILISLILYSLSDKINSRIDIEKNSGLEIYGIIPFLKKQKQVAIEVFNNPQSKYTESFRKLRTNLQFLSKKNNSSSVIVVTSIDYKDGKSTTLSNLSAILQLSGYKTIVIDLDLYKPSLHSFFDIDMNEGVSGYLAGKYNLGDIVFSTAYPNLDIIPVGTIPFNPSELILSDKVEKMIERLRERYDYILIDSTPIASLTDTLNLMRYSDINLVVLKANKAKKVSLSKIEEMVTKYSLRSTGFILNAVSVGNIKDNNII